MNPTYLPGPGDSATWGPVMSSRDPRFNEFGPEFPDEDTALEMATEDELATPYSWAYFLHETVEKTEPVKTCIRASSDWFAGDKTVDELLAVVMDCADWDIVREARAELRDRFLAWDTTKEQIKDRAVEIQQEPLE